MIEARESFHISFSVMDAPVPFTYIAANNEATIFIEDRTSSKSTWPVL